jgi:threonine/homoserine/homoserine lactone efflux protein
MLGIHHFGVFLTSCLLLNLTPGPDTLYILGRTIAQGRAPPRSACRRSSPPRPRRS